MKAMQAFPSNHPVMHTPLLWHPAPQANREGHTMLLCRKSFKLKEAAGFRVWVSASQRYVLYVDGELLGRGPSRGDQERWGVKAYDLNLQAGEHVFAVLITHRGKAAGKAQLGGPGFFLLACEDEMLKDLISTGAEWLSYHHTKWEAVKHRAGARKKVHLSVGDGEAFYGEGFPYAWTSMAFETNQSWQPMKVLCQGVGNQWGNRPGGHHFRVDPLPEMKEWGLETPAGMGWSFPVKIEAGQQWTGVLDHGVLTNAYLSLKVSGGRGSLIEIVSAEAPIYLESEATGHGTGLSGKGNRDELEGKELPGMLDHFYPAGQAGEFFETVWFRPFRYLEFRVTAGDQPVTLESLDMRGSAFPLEQLSSFEPGSDQQRWERILAMTQRTAMLCAHETLFDCPHYEQGQFGGDSRIQVMYQYLNANDDRLARKCIDDLAASRTWLGILRSHYPADFYQIIPTFSLHWLGMLHEFRVYRGDADFLKNYLPQAREILNWFESHRREDGMLGHIPYAPFTDWAFPYGNAPQDEEGGSSILTMLFAQACQWMVGLEQFCGYEELVPRWWQLSVDLIKATKNRCWDEERGLMADTSSKTSYSVHAQTESLLVGAFRPQWGAVVIDKALSDPKVTQPSSFYYRYHLGMALLQAEAGDRVHGLMEDWFKLLDGTGLSTLPENLNNPRSDCHAWGVFSGIAPYTHILGVRADPSVSGMKRVIWQPNLGEMPEASGSIATPHGSIEIQLKRDDDTVRGQIQSPIEVSIPALEQVLSPGVHEISWG